MNTITYSSYRDEHISYSHAVRSGQQRDDYAPHSHEICELLFIKRGDMSYTVDGRRYMLRANNLVFSRPFDIHSIDVEGEEDYERYNILFDEKLLPFDLYEKLPKKLDVISFDGNQSVINLFDKMDFYCDKLSGAELGRMLTHLTEEVFFNILIESATACADAYTQTNTLVCAAIAYIEEHLLTVGSIDEICRELYITKSHLHHLFMKHLQISPKKYITAKRLALAKREIHSGGKPTEVCAACGFSDYSAFWRAYTSHFGCKPSEKYDSEHAFITVGRAAIERSAQKK